MGNAFLLSQGVKDGETASRQNNNICCRGEVPAGNRWYKSNMRPRLNDLIVYITELNKQNHVYSGQLSFFRGY